MRSVEIQARSVDEAVRLALEQLGRTRDQVHIEILMDSSDEEDGEALVRVTAKDGAPSRGRGKGGGATTRPSPGVRPVSRPYPEPASAPRVDAETEQVVKSIVHGLLSAMGFQCTVMAVDNPSLIPIGPDEPPTVFIDVHGRDLGMLIGRRGENLAQLQYLINVLVNKRLDTWTRVILDIEGYRSRREESLINLARRVARQVARNGRPISLEPMPANERRVVHVALRDDPEVTTSSSGEGALRRVTVYPK
ncbi:RNA-binding cell elongation regulator Jag/EloR [Sphaerobacter thermophilus]|uniref:RNA-binding protein KhpB n=1 Tax=Sphaerobacter thermophilus (strain ATCC 49802 / DSM 20745 / KCCM 41009 / NCIMB 13125 / S 6022) TaxID=479434 RepID=D1C668_SPHTD|nr:RNA-binding cell elongation regulator Jag/EloR [Sphaerobacter thermophilus]ACZ37606.1 single-stranded nucleic acid binding R3H domain protein [Sphaerobacter thermophilus DSM 20745]